MNTPENRESLGAGGSQTDGPTCTLTQKCDAFSAYVGLMVAEWSSGLPSPYSSGCVVGNDWEYRPDGPQYVIRVGVHERVSREFRASLKECLVGLLSSQPTDIQCSVLLLVDVVPLSGH